MPSPAAPMPLRNSVGPAISSGSSGYLETTTSNLVYRTAGWEPTWRGRSSGSSRLVSGAAWIGDGFLHATRWRPNYTSLLTVLENILLLAHDGHVHGL